MKYLILLTMLCATLNTVWGQKETTLDEIFTRLNSDNPGTEELDEKIVFVISDFPATEKDNVVIQKGDPKDKIADIKGKIEGKDLVFDLTADTANLGTMDFVVIEKGKDKKNRYKIPRINKDAGAKEQETATFRLPASTLNILAPNLSNNNQCQPCDSLPPRMVYDYRKKKISTGDKYNRVGKPFILEVNDINPFRDSVNVSHRTANYVDSALLAQIAGLFNVIPKIPTGGGKMESSGSPDVVPGCIQLIADVYALGNQIQLQKKILSQLRDCDDICAAIQTTKAAVDTFFRQKWGQGVKESTESCIIRQLQCVYNIKPLADSIDQIKEKVSAILIDYNSFYRAATYFQYVIPQLEDVDEYIFDLSIVPRPGMSSSAVVSHQPISVPLVGGFKVDVSSGLFVTGLRDDQFMLKPDSSVLKTAYGGDSLVYNRRNKIITQNNGRADFGISALMHFYTRIHPWINVSASLGVGVSVGPDPALRYLGGVSLIVGRNGRLVLSYGCAAGYVKRLADGYQDQDYLATTDKSQITKRVFGVDDFASLTFSIPIFKTKVNTAKNE